MNGPLYHGLTPLSLHALAPQKIPSAIGLGCYFVQPTADGQWTIYSETMAEGSHCKRGALTETLNCYFLSTKIKELLQLKKHITVLEIGFGVGIAHALLIQYLSLKDPLNNSHGRRHLHYIGIEMDPALIEFGNKYICNLSPSLIDPNFSHSLELRVGDAREIVKTLALSLSLSLSHSNKQPIGPDVIFHDAFSYTKNPQLWTFEWFQNLYDLCHLESILATFSAATRIRKILSDVGFILTSGIYADYSRGHTIARLQGIEDPMITKKIKNFNLLQAK